MKPSERRGAYTADRAAALSGVPKSTVHYWARQEILVPCVSAERVKLWSYADLLGLRTIAWLRQPKQARDGSDVPRTAMPAVRRALAELRELDLALWTEDSEPRVAVDRRGQIHLQISTMIVEDLNRARPLDVEFLDLIRPYTSVKGAEGPDLHAPRPLLRIVPGKLAGSPHIVHTRIETVAIAALRDRDLSSERIGALYPIVGSDAIAEALDLEQQLRRNLAA